MTRLDDRSEKRRLLILQGPVGRFFGALVKRATARGRDVTKIHFNAADQFFHGGGTEIAFDQPLETFADWLERWCREKRPDAILVFGDRRQMHIAASAVAEKLRIPFYAFEEGYLRPDFVTFEAQGNNARSPMSVDPAVIRAAQADQPGIVHLKPAFAAMTASAIAYYVLLALGRSRFPSYRHHRARSLAAETAGWWCNVWRRVTATLPDRSLQQSLISRSAQRYFVVAMQVQDDLQLVHHGGGWTQERLIDAAIASFARHAPPDARLVFRCHPYDRGHSSHGCRIAAAAAGHGVAERVSFLQTGHGPSLLASAAGLVTINSTMALSAIYHACPVFALGCTFYRVPGLVAAGTDEDALAAFWQAPPPVDQELSAKYLAMVRDQALVNGSFYRSDLWDAMIDRVLSRIDADQPSTTWQR